mgnify:CR=1 FL=1
MNPTTVGELKAKLSEYADDELVLVDGTHCDRDIASVVYDEAVDDKFLTTPTNPMRNKTGYLVICGTNEGM